VVQSIARMSFRDGRPLDEAKSVFLGRLKAIADSFAAFTETSAETANLRDIVETGLKSFSDRADITGPGIAVPAKAAQTIGLVIHELATNSAKYGALSVPTGRIDISWTVDAAGPAPRFAFAWTESGGPPVSAPARAGLGTALLTQIA